LFVCLFMWRLFERAKKKQGGKEDRPFAPHVGAIAHATDDVRKRDQRIHDHCRIMAEFIFEGEKEAVLVFLRAF